MPFPEDPEDMPAQPRRFRPRSRFGSGPGRTPGLRSEVRPKVSPETRALVSLLADEDPKIMGLVRENLARLGPAGFPALQEACGSPDPRLRARARHVLALLSLDQVEKDLKDLAGADDTS